MGSTPSQLTSLQGLDNLCRVGEAGLFIYENPLLPESEVDEFLARVEVLGPIERMPRAGP
jgi:hypothetical protein